MHIIKMFRSQSVLCLLVVGAVVTASAQTVRGIDMMEPLTQMNKVAAAAIDAKPFKRHDHVPVLLNKVGPYNNPHETYRYLHLPFCKGKVGTEDEHQDMGHSLGEIFSGDRKTTSSYDITFRDDVQWRVLCSRTLTPKDVELFRKSVEEEWYFEMYMDGLPMWGFVGDFHDDFVWHRENKAHHYIFTHLKFEIAYNINEKGYQHIVGVNVTTDPHIRTDLHLSENENDPIDVDFTYSVTWKHSKVTLENRMKAYNQVHFLPGQIEIHWLSVINSCVLVILLVSFLTIILMKVLRSDIVRYMGIDDLEDDLEGEPEEEAGWKLIHGHVFRSPQPQVLFCSMIGVGAQFFTMMMALLSLALLGIFSPTRRGGVSTAAVLLYTATSFIGGYVSSRLYRQLSKGDGGNWVWTSVSTILMFPVPCVVVFILVNSTAWANNSTAALPFGTIMVLLSLFLLGVVPLSVLGTVIGRNTSSDFEAPCRVHKVPRQVPSMPFYRSSLVHILVGGFLPFSAVYIEMHYIFEAMWGHKIYTLFGILFLAICLVVLVTAFITIALTYFQLAVEVSGISKKKIIMYSFIIFLFLFLFSRP